MPGFFKTFFAALLALIVFCLLGLLFAVIFLGPITKKAKPRVTSKTVLVLDLDQHFKEQSQSNPFAILNQSSERNIPGLYDIIRLIQKAKTDNHVSGIYLLSNDNANGFAASDEIRDALIDFKKSGKFLLAYGDVISQRAYSIANIADTIWLGPNGAMEWRGYSAELAFLKGTLEKLNIQPQIFYAGKFKSATEPFRTDQMTEENRIQTSAWLNDLYNELLIKSAESRKLDSAELRRLADEAVIQTPQDALDHKLVDGLKYEDEVRDEIRKKIGVDKNERINFISINNYMDAGKFFPVIGDKIALIYAEGSIVDGKEETNVISTENYRKLIRNARLDKTVKAIVFRVNSGGGSALASENIWRELALAKKEKPVVVSFGDVAASGGYYISCGADSIFAKPSTITGSIGVFGIIPNLQDFFRNKLGVTFDGVKTGPYADAGAMYRPLSDKEKSLIQAEIDRIYSLFKLRVADGRKRDTTYIDSIAQGRVWTGQRAIQIGLIDKFGGLNDAIKCAAGMAKLKDYRVKEYPEPVDLFDRILKGANPFDYTNKMKEEIGPENYKILEELKKVKAMCNTAQARLPFEFNIR